MEILYFSDKNIYMYKFYSEVSQLMKQTKKVAELTKTNIYQRTGVGNSHDKMLEQQFSTAMLYHTSVLSEDYRYATKKKI